MSKEKQIEEIRKDIFAAFGGYAKWEEDWQSLAEAVCDAGYRKQSENKVELPCMVGDKIYEVIQDEELSNGCGVFELTVTEIGQNHIWVSAYNPPRDDFDVNYPISEIGKSIFFTREEAKESLKVAQ